MVGLLDIIEFLSKIPTTKFKLIEYFGAYYWSWSFWNGVTLLGCRIKLWQTAHEFSEQAVVHLQYAGQRWNLCAQETSSENVKGSFLNCKSMQCSISEGRVLRHDHNFTGISVFVPLQIINYGIFNPN